MNYWLVKTEPETYSWGNLIQDKKTTWDGVRNFRARSNLKKMAKGDLVFIYHTGDEKAIIGLARVIREAFPDPKDKDWVAVELAPQKKTNTAGNTGGSKGKQKLSSHDIGTGSAFIGSAGIAGRI
ncbi:EVE domain-containing protein [Oscillatoria amoena NRMC-F 0135]|nr:EVE domain-containing protein [Oscillatoria amoena NRMC-F 0135]